MCSALDVILALFLFPGIQLLGQRFIFAGIQLGQRLMFFQQGPAPRFPRHLTGTALPSSIPTAGPRAEHSQEHPFKEGSLVLTQGLRPPSASFLRFHDPPSASPFLCRSTHTSSLFAITFFCSTIHISPLPPCLSFAKQEHTYLRILCHYITFLLRFYDPPPPLPPFLSRSTHTFSILAIAFFLRPPLPLLSYAGTRIPPHSLPSHRSLFAPPHAPPPPGSPPLQENTHTSSLFAFAFFLRLQLPPFPLPPLACRNTHIPPHCLPSRPGLQALPLTCLCLNAKGLNAEGVVKFSANRLEQDAMHTAAGRLKKFFMKPVEIQGPLQQEREKVVLAVMSKHTLDRDQWLHIRYAKAAMIAAQFLPA